ncbi:hypothetical protein NDU88_003537 [Pleurodeles waltl]|uniref:Uncharacterized protein n=1 Tax=Pleurodeles waltl TaxID=8319 RepID=A0AAV7SEW8_PLEWA|nr:hypothetical protein NDU88_003537 [Pleurodeles waltl]
MKNSAVPRVRLSRTCLPEQGLEQGFGNRANANSVVPCIAAPNSWFSSRLPGVAFGACIFQGAQYPPGPHHLGEPRTSRQSSLYSKGLRWRWGSDVY